MQMATHILQGEVSLKFVKGSMVTMRGEMLSNNFYKLFGDTISGGAAISTPENSENDSTHHDIYVLAI